MSYSLHPDAEQDLNDALDFYVEHAGHAVALRFLNEFERVASLLDEHPAMGTPAGNGRRVFPLRMFPYSVVYRRLDAGVRIVVVRAPASQTRLRCVQKLSLQCRQAHTTFKPARLALRHRSSMLETRDLTIRFGGHVAVDAVSCRFAPGTLTAIVGPNGAGKTTYFNSDLGPAQGERGLGQAGRARVVRSRCIGTNPCGHRPGVSVDQPVFQPHGARERAARAAGHAPPARIGAV